MSEYHTQEGTADWTEAEEVIGDAIGSLVQSDIWSEAGPKEIMRALEAAGFLVIKRGTIRL